MDFALAPKRARDHTCFSSYAALMRKIIDSKPSTYEEVVKQQVCGRMP
jgi:hypothetical protein